MQQPPPPQQQQGVAEAPDGSNLEKQPSKKSLFPGRASARGAALISSMRNLSLGGALRGNNNNNANQGKKEVQDWEKQWDEDDEEDSDEEEISSGRQGAPLTARIGTAPPMHAMRPGMDTGHSEMTGSPSVSTPPDAAKPGEGKLNFVTPDGDGVYDAPASPTHQRTTISAPTSPTVIPESDDDGLEWDTGDQAEDARPNVQMFMPMLRVLGKGSFGKVGYEKLIQLLFIC